MPSRAEQLNSLDPASVGVSVRAVEDGDPSGEVILPDGTRCLLGETLAELRERFGGEVIVEDWLGGRHRISLSPWASWNPRTTRIVIGFFLQPEAGLDETASGSETDVAAARFAGATVDLRPTGAPGSGVTLRQVRERLATTGGMVEDQHGRRYPVSVDHLKEMDPDSTYVQIVFRTGPLDLRDPPHS
jgi:hypothetical protein